MDERTEVEYSMIVDETKDKGCAISVEKMHPAHDSQHLEPEQPVEFELKMLNSNKIGEDIVNNPWAWLTPTTITVGLGVMIFVFYRFSYN